ncbi:MAG: hypothetical protein CR967_04175 [Proteobacteria bacterium]|nr:MAG: hypothetical protein CR967_04175 [Pseudomonadota bacterium]
MNDYDPLKIKIEDTIKQVGFLSSSLKLIMDIHIDEIRGHLRDELKDYEFKNDLEDEVKSIEDDVDIVFHNFCVLLRSLKETIK